MSISFLNVQVFAPDNHSTAFVSGFDNVVGVGLERFQSKPLLRSKVSFLGSFAVKMWFNFFATDIYELVKSSVLTFRRCPDGFLFLQVDKWIRIVRLIRFVILEMPLQAQASVEFVEVLAIVKFIDRLLQRDKKFKPLPSTSRSSSDKGKSGGMVTTNL